MISTGDMKRGATIELDGRVYQVMEFAHIKMGRGSAQMRMKLRDVRRAERSLVEMIVFSPRDV